MRILDGHNYLVTPDPIPNSEVKLVMFAFVLSLMGTRGAVYLDSFFLEKRNSLEVEKLQLF